MYLDLRGELDRRQISTENNDLRDRAGIVRIRGDLLNRCYRLGLERMPRISPTEFSTGFVDNGMCRFRNERVR